MAKARVWDSNSIVSNLTVNDDVVANEVLRSDDGAVYPGQFWLNRLVGQVTVFVDNYVAGSSLRLWHGLLLHEIVSNPVNYPILQADGQDEKANAGSWLWREPIPLWTTPTAVSVNDFIVQHEFDWPIRGGRGSQLRTAQQMSYIVQLKTNSAPGSVEVRTDYIGLFSGS